MSEKKDYVENGVNDVYFGRAECFKVAGIEFNRFGFAFGGNVRNCKFDVLDVSEADGLVWVEFHTFGQPVVAIGIPKTHITIPEN
jgi:hypothetical protein